MRNTRDPKRICGYFLFDLGCFFDQINSIEQRDDDEERCGAELLGCR